MIIFESTNITSRGIGTLKKIPTKVFVNTTVSTNGVINETHVRGKMNFEVNIVKIDQDEYDYLCDIFLLENDFNIKDTDRGLEGRGYKLSGETFSLTEIENKKEKNFYYTGNFNVEKL